MPRLERARETLRVVAGAAVPLLILAAALLWVDPLLLGGAALALGTTFGVVYGYARYVEFDVGGADPRVGEAEGRRASDDRVE